MGKLEFAFSEDHGLPLDVYSVGPENISGQEKCKECIPWPNVVPSLRRLAWVCTLCKMYIYVDSQIKITIVNSNNTGTTHYDSLQGSYWTDQRLIFIMRL